MRKKAKGKIHNQIIQLSIIILFCCLSLYAVYTYAFLMMLMFMSCISVIFLRSIVKNTTLFFPFYTQTPPGKKAPWDIVSHEGILLRFYAFFLLRFLLQITTQKKLHIKFNLQIRKRERQRIRGQEKAEASRSSLILLA